MTPAALRGEVCAECGRRLAFGAPVPSVCGRCFFRLSDARREALVAEDRRLAAERRDARTPNSALREADR